MGGKKEGEVKGNEISAH